MVSKLYALMTFGALDSGFVLFSGNDWLAFMLRVTVWGPWESQCIIQWSINLTSTTANIFFSKYSKKPRINNFLNISNLALLKKNNNKTQKKIGTDVVMQIYQCKNLGSVLIGNQWVAEFAGTPPLTDWQWHSRDPARAILPNTPSVVRPVPLTRASLLTLLLCFCHSRENFSHRENKI